jgi:NAD(P)-dependent dehydrogenase (short-subunit alcohol dehydrogenase family)
MKVIIIGATGTIGSAASSELSKQHEVIRVGYSDGDYQVDIASKESIKTLFSQIGKVDAIVSTTGLANFGTLDSLSDADYQLALNNKLMGQVNLVRLGRDYLNDGGSITLTSGITAWQPMQESLSVSMVNAGLEGFAKAAALGMDRGTRVNVVSPDFVRETAEAMGMGSIGVPAAQTALAYAASIEGEMNGETLNVRDYI